MNTSKTNLVTAMAGLGAMSINANVGMDEVVSIFISRLEEDLHNQRKSCQATLISKSNEIKELTTQLVSTLRVAIKSVERVVEDEFVKSTTTLNSSEPTVQWEYDQVIFYVSQKFETKLPGRNNYSGNSTNTVPVAMPIDDGIKSVYSTLMGDKSKITDRLNQIQTELRDLSRRERAVRAKVAEMKLNDAGMGDLLNNSDLLQLVDLGNIIEG